MRKQIAAAAALLVGALLIAGAAVFALLRSG